MVSISADISSLFEFAVTIRLTLNMTHKYFFLLNVKVIFNGDCITVENITYDKFCDSGLIALLFGKVNLQESLTHLCRSIPYVLRLSVVIFSSEFS